VSFDVVLPQVMLEPGWPVSPFGGMLVSKDPVYRYHFAVPRLGYATVEYQVTLKSPLSESLGVELVRYQSAQYTAQAKFLTESHQSSLLTVSPPTSLTTSLEVAPTSVNMRIGEERSLSAQLVSVTPITSIHRQATGARWTAASEDVRVIGTPSGAVVRVRGIRAGLTSLKIRDGRFDSFVEVDVLPDGTSVTPHSTTSTTSRPQPPSTVLTLAGQHDEAAALPPAQWQGPLPTGIVLSPLDNSVVNSSPIACSGPSTCVAVGYVDTEFDGNQTPYAALAVSHGGVWGPARIIKGAPAWSEFNSVSCWSSKGCVVVGSDFNPADYAIESTLTVHGWSAVKELSGTTTDGTYGAEPAVVSCSDDGYCIEGGQREDFAQDDTVAYIDVRANGVWGSPLPSTGSMYPGPNARISSISCGSPGNCVAAGEIGDSSYTAFAIALHNGHLGRAVVLGQGSVEATSCDPVGGCSVAAMIANSGLSQPVVRSEVGGSWLAPITLGSPGTWTIASISCPAAERCTVAGGSTSGGVVVDNEAGSTWRPPRTLLPANGYSPSATSISCGQVGFCVATGLDEGQNFDFLISEFDGVWGDPYYFNLSAPTDPVPAVSCSLTNACAFLVSASSTNGVGAPSYLLSSRTTASVRVLRVGQEGVTFRFVGVPLGASLTMHLSGPGTNKFINTSVSSDAMTIGISKLRAGVWTLEAQSTSSNVSVAIPALVFHVAVVSH
jgi:hypothetical protein